MHEMALVRNVVDIVLARAEELGATEVKTVYLTIGYGRDIVEEYMDGLFKFLARDTIAKDADLVMQRVPITAKCNQCGQVFPLNLFKEETWKCPACGAEKDYKLNSGMEFAINGMEIETPAPAEEAPEETAPAAQEAPAEA